MKPLAAELNRSRKLGVEHEFFLPLVGGGSRNDVQNMIAHILSRNGIRAVARPYCHEILPPDVDIAVETDSSIHGTQVWQGVVHVPIEIKTRIVTYDEWEALVPKTLEIVRYLGGRVNQSCGHHVHLGLLEVKERPAVVRSLYNLFHRYEKVILGSLVSPSRRENGYCRPMPDRSRLLHGCNSASALRRALGHWERHYGLNLTHLWEEQPHLELRYHQGTLDPEKSRHWLRFCLQMVQHAVNRNCQAGDQVENDKRGMSSLLTTCGFRPNYGIYRTVCPELRETGRYLLLKRFRHFHRREKTSSAGEDA